jgi:bacterioferritin
VKGDKNVLKVLVELLVSELSAADQYFVHSEMYQDWGFTKLHEHTAHERDEELDHAKKLIARILFLEGTPDVHSRDPIKVGKDVPAMLRNDLAVELAVGKALKAAIAVCEKASDYVSRDILVGLLDDTEMDHTYWLEKQLGLIEKMGLENYLQSSAS